MYESKRIKNAEIVSYPYPHIEVEDIFSPEMYVGILANFPNTCILPKSRSYSRQLDIVPDPGVKDSYEGKYEYINVLSGFEYDFWDRFKLRFFEGEFVETLMKKFNVRDNDYYACGRLQIETEGAGLGPHTDRKDKLISVVFYIDENEDACGTELCKPKKTFKAGERHYGYDDFEIVKSLSYKPNKMIAWPVVPNSFHSYHQSKPTERRTIKFFIQHFEDPIELQGRIAETKQYADDWRKTV